MLIVKCCHTSGSFATCDWWHSGMTWPIHVTFNAMLQAPLVYISLGHSVYFSVNVKSLASAVSVLPWSVSTWFSADRAWPSMFEGTIWWQRHFDSFAQWCRNETESKKGLIQGINIQLELDLSGSESESTTVMITASGLQSQTVLSGDAMSNHVGNR